MILGLVLVFISTLFGSVASFFFKKGANLLNKKTSLNHLLIIGGFIYVLATIFYVAGLKFGDLSYLYPLNSLAYIWIAIISYFFLKEKMNFMKIFGIVLIIAGVVFIGFGA